MVPGSLFNYRELGISPEDYGAATKAIERLIKRDVIERSSKGLFYVPKQTAFGRLQPREEELLKRYLFKGTQRTAYVTGITLYNKMGLTTQVPKNITLACRDKRIAAKIGSFEIKSVKSYVDVTNNNYRFLELLDVIKDLNSIPDADKSQILRFILEKLAGFSENERNKLIEVALKYPPRVRALTGALLCGINPAESQQKLKASISPLSIYRLGIDSAQLPGVQEWNIA